jgi:outer membrane protein assembly factor BamB
MLTVAACGEAPNGAAAVASVTTGVASTATTPATVAATKKRAPPEPVTPVVIGKIRFEAPINGKVRGLGQNGGLVVAIDTTTGNELWFVLVYSISYASNLEADKQDLFITDMAASADGRALIVNDERGRRWRVDLATRTSARDAPG